MPLNSPKRRPRTTRRLIALGSPRVLAWRLVSFLWPRGGRRGGDMNMAILEKEIQTSIEELLALQENLGRLVYQKNNSGAIKVKHPGGKSSFLRFGKPGSPDFLVWRPSKVNAFDNRGSPCPVLETLFIEIKTKKGKMSPLQKEFQAKIEKLGGKYYLARSFEDVKKIIL